MMIVFASLAALGLALVATSSTLWVKAPTGAAIDRGESDTTQKLRLYIFIGWTLLIPAIMLIEWMTIERPTGINVPPFAYGRKVVTDLWTAIAAVLALLWGIKK